MAYQKTNWQDHVVEFPNRYVQTAGAAGTTILTKSEGNIVQPGTTISATNLNKIEVGVEDAHSYLSEQAKTKATLKNGLQVVNADTPTPFNVLYHGRTLINLLKNISDFYKITNWTVSGNVSVSTTITKDSLKSFRFLTTGGTAYANRNYDVIPNKKYLSYVWVYIDSVTTGQDHNLQIYDVTGTMLSVVKAADTSILGKWQILPVHFSASDTTTSIRFRIGNINVNGTTTVFYSDGCLFEISQTEYDDLVAGLLTKDQIATKYPYIERIKPVKNPIATVIGKNLTPGPGSWVNGFYNSGAFQASTTKITNTQEFDLIIGQTYTMSVESGYIARLYAFQTTGTATSYSNGSNVYTFAVGIYNKSAHFDISRVDGLSMNTDEYFKANPMIVVGNVVRPFVPYNEDHEYIEADLYDGDYVFEKDGNYLKNRAKEFLVLDGSLNWYVGANYSGYKRLDIAIAGAKDTSQQVIKYDGKVLEQRIDWTAGDLVHISSTHFYVSVSDTESGWSDTFMPGANFIRAYFNGWKYTGDGTTHSWVSLVGGVAAATQTEAFVSDPINMPIGFIPYELVYQLVINATEAIQGEFGLSLQEGGSHVELGQGVIIHEKVTPTQHATNKTWWINESGYTTQVLDNPLNKKAKKIIAIYKNGVKDNLWVISTSSANTNGEQYANTKTDSDYSPDSVYTVVYMALGSNGSSILKADANYNSSPKSTLNEMVKDVADQQRINSSQDMQIYNLLVAAKANGWEV